MKRLFYLISFLTLFFSCSVDNSSVLEEVEYLTLSQELIDVPSKGGTYIVEIMTNTSWEIVKNTEWIDVDILSDSLIQMEVEPNLEERQRSGSISILSSVGENHITVIQQEDKILKFECDTVIELDGNESTLDVDIISNIAYEFEIIGDDTYWLSVEKKYKEGQILNNTSRTVISDGLKISVEANKKSVREGKIRIFNDSYRLCDTLVILQKASDSLIGYHTDGEYNVVYKSDVGDANLVVMGDGFTSKDLSVGGKYDISINSAIDYFFSIEPYSTYRDYFNVYSIVTESKQDGIGKKNILSSFNTSKSRFEIAFGTGTEIVCNSDAVLQCARTIPGLEDKQLTIIVVLNSNNYAGTTYLMSDGNSIALCPMSDRESPNDFEGLIHHEAGGHGFGFLCDEYVYSESTIPTSEIQNIREWQKLGFQMNLDFTNIPGEALWSGFIGHEKYEHVGLYEGGQEYRYGVWRCEDNSCMNNNIPYFNTQSRWCIVNRIMSLSSIDYTLEDFIRDDNVRPIEERSRTSNPLYPLGAPKLICVSGR